MYQQQESSNADYSLAEWQDDATDDEEEEGECGVCGQTSCECGELAALLLAQPTQDETIPATSASVTLSPPFACPACQQWFVVQDKLVLHLVLNHSMVYCKFCKRLFASQAEHATCTAHRGSAACSTCGLQCRVDSSTLGHELALHEAQEHDTHACPLCGITLRLREALLQHMRRRHLCTRTCDEAMLGDLPRSGIVAECTGDANAWAFMCNLCNQQIPRSELFNHFHSNHHLSLPCLIELLHCGRVFIPVLGYQPSSCSETPSLPVLSPEDSTTSETPSCAACSQPYTTQVPKTVHDVLCAGMAYCQYCALSFPSGLARELHVVRAHSSLECVACGESFPAETSLTAHHSRAHSAVLCCCCDALVVPTDMQEHLVSQHACRVPLLGTSLCLQIQPQLQASSRGGISTCCLCEEQFSAEQAITLFSHLCQYHAVSATKSLNLLLSQHVQQQRQQVKSEESEGDEINTSEPGESLQFPVSENWPTCEESGSLLVPQVDLPSSESVSEDDHDGSTDDETIDINTHAEPEVDPDVVECVTDSSDDENNEVITSRLSSCELCSEEALGSPRALCAHMRAAHHMYWNHKNASNTADTTAPDTQYTCDRCSHRAGDRPTLAKHRTQTHPGEPRKSFQCHFCDQNFMQASARDQHQLQVHPDQQNSFYRCPVCQMLSSSTVMLSRHLRTAHSQPTHHGVRFKCRICFLLFSDMSDLRSHFQATHPATMILRCRHCAAHLKTRRTLRNHVRVVHFEARRRDCDACGKVFWTKRAYAIHFRMKHSKTYRVGFRCRICQQRFDTKEQRKLHYTLDHEGESPYHCKDCGKGFASKSGMYGHRQLHTGSGISKCQYCGKEFTRKDSYNEHLLIHNGPRHKCPHCPKEFVQRSNLVRHIRIHTGEKPYQCTFCEKRFSDKGACNSHIRVHTGEETCSCPYCGQTFSKKQKLKYHIRKHTGEGLIECEICNKMFTNSFALKEHRVIHNRQTQVVCPQCGKGFNSEKYLQRHVAIVHEPSNAFSCPLCKKTFSQQARLRAHLMTHSGVKHMKCLLCEKAYSVRKSLRRHLLEKHEVSPDHPQYKHCFHAMSPEEAGIEGLTAAVTTVTTPPPRRSPKREPLGSSGRKRRRVEQIVQSLQHSLQAEPTSSSSAMPTLARLLSLPRSRKLKRTLTPPARLPSDEEDTSGGDEGLNLTVQTKTEEEDSGGDS